MIELCAIAAVIMGIAEAAKRKGLNKKLIPIINILVGVLVCIIFLDSPIRVAAFEGLVAGLAASGIYSGAKNVCQALKKDEVK